jgi:7-cyano-7-deazaguanine synthase
MPDDRTGARSAAVLCSGGLDSAVLCVDLLREFDEVFPIYVRFGLRWEETELSWLRSYLAEAGATRAGLRPLTVLEEPVKDVYGDHWSLAGGSAVPGAQAAAAACFLPGRNVLLAAKAALWCRLRAVETLCFGTLQGNPHPDSSAEFFSALETVLNRATNGNLRILRPYAALSKAEVIRRGSGLPLHLTFSCFDPVGGRPCGVCDKCDERQQGFRAAGCPDRTPYAVAEPAAPG